MRNKEKFLRNAEGFLFISPWLVGFLIFTLVPVFVSLYLAFTDYDFFHTPKWTGLDNMMKMVHSDLFWQALRVTFTYAFLSVPLHLFSALLAAIALNTKLKGIGFYRTVFYLPSFIGGSIGVAVMWRMLLSNDGAINSFLLSLGLERIRFLNDIHTVLYTIIFIQIWVLGTAMLVFLAGLQQIPQELYDAAKVDGAGSLRRFRSITIPMLTPVIFFNLVMGIVGAMKVFTAGYVIAPKGGPAHASYFYVIYLYQEAFKYFHMGYASLLAWVLFVIILIFTLLVFRSSKIWVFYENDVKGNI